MSAFYFVKKEVSFLSLLRPTVYLKSVFDITPELLNTLGIKALLLDVDNTLAIYRTTVPVDGVMSWLERMRSNGIKLHILSNGKPGRLTEFANNTGLDCFYMSLKPLPFKIIKAVRKIGVKKGECALVGDQLFTDILGGKFAGIKTVWVDIIEPETKLSFRFKRKIEKFIKKNMKWGVQ